MRTRKSLKKYVQVHRQIISLKRSQQIRFNLSLLLPWSSLMSRIPRLERLQGVMVIAEAIHYMPKAAPSQKFVATRSV
jgi:hypothetical protein